MPNDPHHHHQQQTVASENVDASENSGASFAHAPHEQVAPSHHEQPTHAHAAMAESHDAHVDHSGHELLFRNRFWVCLLLTLPVLLYSPMLQMWFGYSKTGNSESNTRDDGAYLAGNHGGIGL